MQKLPNAIGRLLCLIGLHDFHLIEATFSFGQGGEVEKVECRRCGLITTRRDPSA